jgi:hypothetical protein
MNWGPQQGSQGYPQQGYGQYPQQRPQQPPPPKKGIGAGVIIAILGAVFALVVLVGGGVAFFVLRSASAPEASSSPPASAADPSASLKTKVETLVAAVKTGKAKQVEGPLLDLVTTPENAKAWFDATFEPKAADDLYGYWNRQVFPNITDMVKPIKSAIAANQTEVRVTRLASMADVEACQLDFCKWQEKANLTKLFAAMKKPQPLYLVSLVDPTSSSGQNDTEVYYFAEVKGGFVYLDSLLL